MYDTSVNMPIKHDVLTETLFKFSYEKPISVFLVCFIFRSFKDFISLKYICKIENKDCS